MDRRIVITGMGVISPVGCTLKDFWDNLVHGRSGIDTIKQVPDIERFSSQVGGEIKNFNPEDYIPTKELRRMDPFTHYGLAAALLAVNDAGLELEKEDRNRIGVLVGSGVGGLQILEKQHHVLADRGPSRLNPFLIPQMIPNILAGHIAIKYGLKGPNFGMNSACATGSHSIGESMRIIQTNDADIMLAGGAEAAITPLGLGGFCVLRALSTRNSDPKGASRPFDKERDGFVIGEGGAVLVLEEMDHALRRGSHIYAELTGYGRNSDANHMTAPDATGESPARSIRLALNDAHLSTWDVDYINAHGTSTPMNDKMETMAIKIALGEKQAKKIAVSSIKSMTGHSLGAAGAIEAVASVLAIKEGVAPPTINYEHPDPDCDLDYVPNTAREMNIKTVLSNSFGFGGHNVSLCFRKFE